MERAFSLYLDLVRFGAALLVVMAHYVDHNLLDMSPAQFLPSLGRESVVAFFVLSGFVIAYTTEAKKLTFKEYVVARCARIYSVALPLLLIAFLIAFIESLYVDSPLISAYQVNKAHIYLPLHFMFLGELWNLSEVPPRLGQYWSLGYEVWYYILFAIAYYLEGVKKVLLGALVLLVVGHKLWLLLPVWLSGIWVYRLYQRYSVKYSIARLGWFVTFVVLAAYKYFEVDLSLREIGNSIWPFRNLQLGSADRFLADYFVCMLVCANFFFASNLKFPRLKKFGGLIRHAASYTFTLYLIHWMVMSLWINYYKPDPSSFLDIAALTALIALATYLIGVLTEHKKALFYAFFESFYELLLGQITRTRLALRNRVAIKRTGNHG